MEERLQKVLAAAGVDSRRACEKIIAAGRVKVNGQVVTELGTKVDPTRVQITVDEKPIKRRNRFVYYKIYKPRGMLSDMGGDTGGYHTVAELLPKDSRRVFSVGRLDLNSEGLMLLTDDGDLAHKLTHPRYQHPKTYYVLLEEMPAYLALDRLRKGIELETGLTAPARVEVVERLHPELRLGPGRREGVWLRMVLREGKKRQIRHMTAAVGYPTLRLVRWSIGPLTMGDMKVGECKPLKRNEVGALRGLSNEPQEKRSLPDENRKSRGGRRVGQKGNQKQRQNPGQGRR
ncbi:MAG: pseudouridine synthase [Chloroflexota bacterium]